MSTVIEFGRIVSYYGRNKFGKQNGLEVNFIAGDPYDCLVIRPTNTRGSTDSCLIEIPKESLLDCIEKMLSESHLSFKDLARKIGYVIGSPFTVHDIEHRFGMLKEQNEWQFDISEQDAGSISQDIERQFDACIGINWDVIDAAIESYFSEKIS